MLASVSARQASLERRHPAWTPRRLDEQLDAAAAEHGDRPYVVTDERTWTYREIAAWSVRLARGLVGAGVRPGELVALVMANHPEFVALKFAIARAGATAVPVNFLNRREELGYVLRQSGAVALITMDAFRDLDYLAMLDELAPGWETAGGGDALPDLRRVIVRTDAAPRRLGVQTVEELGATAEGWTHVTSVGPDDPADVLYTSGTTGSPKGVLLTHDMLLRTAYGSAFARAFEDSRRVLFSLPLYHVYGYVEGMLATVFVGGSIVPQLTFSPATTLRAIGAHRASDILLIPTMTQALLDELETDGTSYDLSSLTSMISSGGVTPTGLWDRLDERIGPIELTTGYGMSETTASTTVTRPDDPRERRLRTNGRLRDVGIAGDPALGGRLAVYRVVDPETGAELPRGAVGELQVRGPGVTPGYYRKPEEDALAFTEDGWLRTGDLGILDQEDYVTLVGRRKDCYRCGGEQVVPKEVEDVLTAHPSVDQAHVVPLPDPKMGEVGVAYVVLRAGHELDVEELLGLCRNRLARFKVPRQVVSIAASDVPVTPSGRPRKFLLAERARAQLGRP